MNRYDDIINLPHHVSKTHPQMSMHDRAAQFSPFAALTGHSDAAQETARLTQEESTLSEDVIEGINRKLASLKARLSENPDVKITFFIQDSRKSGGRYQTTQSTVRKIDESSQILVLDDGTAIPFMHIRYIE